MIRTTKAPFAWTVPFGEGGTVFMLRAGDIIERGELEAELAELGGGRVFDFQIEDAFDSGVAFLLKDHPDYLARIREVAAAQAALEMGDQLPPEELALLDGAREAVKAGWPPFRTLIGQAAKRSELIPTLAFQRFCTGWQGDGLPEFRKSMDGRVDLSVMAEVPAVLIRLAGLRAYQALYASEHEGNSARPLQSDKSPPPSNSDASKKGGSSGKRSGGKTPSRRRPRGASGSSTSGSTADA
ncbi:MAG TPA: hypothetical protein VM662_09260 [Sphingomonas sp.]|nr:hypothetical protein [Sphingomonas sp.]